MAKQIPSQGHMAKQIPSYGHAGIRDQSLVNPTTAWLAMADLEEPLKHLFDLVKDKGRSFTPVFEALPFPRACSI